MIYYAFGISLIQNILKSLTEIYSTILVVLVAAILAFAALSLQDKQNENVKLETVSKLLGAASQADGTFTIEEGADVLGLYADHITDAFYVDGNGNRVGEMNMGKEDKNAIEVTTTSDLKKQNDIMKKIEAGDASLKPSLRMPVYVFDINGAKITVIPCYGAGLWGPIWGYIALNADGKTITGAVFDHKGETPGLGSKIADAPFCNEFKGKTLDLSSAQSFAVAKPGSLDNPEHGVDAISGATITSRALGLSIDMWARNYSAYLIAAAAENENAQAAADELTETNENVEE